MNVGRMIFYDLTDGSIIVNTNEYSQVIRKKTAEQQIETYKELSERNRETFDYIELEYGQYAQDFKEGRLVGINLETKEPIFEYPNPENPSEPIVPEKPLTTQIAELKKEKDFLEVKLKANSDRTDFLEEVVTELILTVM